MLKDLRHAVRVLFHAKGWTLVVILSLALGIGANTALFSAANGLLLKQLPGVEDPDSLVRFRWAGRNEMANSMSLYGVAARTPDGVEVSTSFSMPIYREFQAANQTLADMFACAPNGRVNLIVDGVAELANAFLSTGNYYQMLGVTAALGRVILPDDDRPDAPAVAVISHPFWRARFASSPQVIGKSVVVNSVPVTIVGVLSPEFNGIGRPSAPPADIAMALEIDRQLNITPPPPGDPQMPRSRLDQSTNWWLLVMGRLKPGVTAEQVQGNFAGVFDATARSGMVAYVGRLTDTARAQLRNPNPTEVPRLLVDSGRHGMNDANPTDVRTVSILTGVVVMVLLIVCANVANLLLSRAASRQRELAVRLSLGATRARLIRQLLTESLLLAFAGGALGVIIGYWAQQLLPGALGVAATLDWRVLSVILLVTTLTGVLFGIAPAFRATRVELNAGLKETSRAVAASRTLLGKSLLVFQVAVSLVLLVGAGLSVKTLANLRAVDIGFDADNLVLFRVSPTLTGYDSARTAVLLDRVTEQLRAVPGVRAVAFSTGGLLTGTFNITNIHVEGRSYGRDDRPAISRLVVSPEFFDTMGIPLLSGRVFSAQDTATAPRVVVINEAAVQKYFPGENPVGRRFGTNPTQSSRLEIVGVVRDTKYNSLREPAPPMMFESFLQARQPGAMFEVRTGQDAASTIAAIREAVRQVDPRLPMMDVSTQVEQIENRMAQERSLARAYTLFGGLAVVLAAIGLFGLMSYSVARRTNEIGLRMALGADQRRVQRQIMRESMILVAVGAIAGVGLAAASSRVIASQLFGLAPTDVPTFALATAIVLSVSALAGYLPARRASRVDPMVALRYE